MTWQWNGRDLTEDDAEKYYGFVYCIHNLKEKKRYIGKKFFTKAGYRQVKGKRKKTRKPSDWPTYWGSNDKLIADVKRLGEENFIREVLHLCVNRSDCAYLELKEQMIAKVLERDDYYNDWLMVKVSKKNLRFLSETEQSYLSNEDEKN
jgi:hypothetical protein